MHPVFDRFIKKGFGHIPSRRLLAMAFLLLLLLSVLLTTYLLVSGGNRIVSAVIAIAAKATNREAHTEVERFLKTSSIIGQSVEDAFLAGYLSVEDQSELSRYFWTLPQRDGEYPVSAVFYSDTKGVFTGLGANRQRDPPVWTVSMSSQKTLGHFEEFVPNKDGSAGKRISRGDLYDSLSRPWYQQAVQSDTPVWTELYRDAITGQPVMTWVSALRSTDQTLAGVIGVDLFLQKIQHFLTQLPVSDHTEVFLFDAEGELISANDSLEEIHVNANHSADIHHRFSTAAIAELRARQDGIDWHQQPFSRQIVLDGEDGFLLTSPISDDIGLDWSIGVFVPASDYLASTHAQLRRVLPLALLVLSIAGAVWLGFLSLVVKPLYQLRNGANKIAAGQFDVPIDTSCTNEVGELASAIDKMRHRLSDAFNQLTRQKVRAETTLATIGDGVITMDGSGQITYMNPAAEQQTGWVGIEVGGQPLQNVFRAREMHSQSLLTHASILNTLMAGEPYDRSLLLEDKEGNTHMIDCHIRSIQGDGKPSNGAVIVFSDVTEQLRLQSELTHQATHDALTGLINRREFDRRLQHAIHQTNASNTDHVLCYIDLDKFKVVNDTCGHVAGDELLRQVAQLLDQQIRSGDTFARLGGDEFALILNHCTTEQAERVTHNLLSAISNYRFTWEKRTFSIGISIGVVHIQGADAIASSVLRDADSACYAAKDAGGNRSHVYSADNKELSDRREETLWVNKIDQALENDSFVLYAQTIAPVQAATTEPYLHHFEVLVRMLDQDGSIIPPGVFLPSAERFNLATKIDRWVVSNTLLWLSEHPAVVDSLEMCSINLSGQSLGDADFLSFILNTCKRFDVPMQRICFEITETATIANLSTAMNLINTLKEQGCTFALDDFGSGLSSFAYLKSLPVDYLKIDGVFVRDILEDSLDLAMVRSINEIGQIMGMKTIAEFVENDDIKAELTTLGVNYVQGYGIGKPQPIEALAD